MKWIIKCFVFNVSRLQDVNDFLYKALYAIGMKDWGMDELLPIVISGHDLYDLKQLLEQTKDKGTLVRHGKISKKNLRVSRRQYFLQPIV